MDDGTGRTTADEIAWLQQSYRTAQPPGRGLPVDPESPPPLDLGSLSPESFAAVIDALAAERGVPRTEIVQRMIQELEDRIAVDRAVISLLRRL